LSATTREKLRLKKELSWRLKKLSWRLNRNELNQQLYELGSD
jgi:hypothetical protein